MTDANTFTIHHLCFTAEVETTIEMDAFKGSALRGAWQSHLRTLYCAETGQTDPLHQAMCPVCFLLSRETGSGDDRRPYAFAPPLTRQTSFRPGERFDFGISLFGQTIQFLPYLVLAVGQMGQHQGLGRPIHPRDDGRGAGGGDGTRRGTFRLARITEVNPLSRQEGVLLAEGDSKVHMPTLPITEGMVADSARNLADSLPAAGCQLTIEFLTPTRIVHDNRLVHGPDFAPFFARLLDRVSALRHQFADQPPLPGDEKAQLLSLADQVTLAGDHTRWWDVKGRSTRLKRPQPLGGFVGQAVYRASSVDVWHPLLPWLLWGQSTQVGKNVVKGCGMMTISV